MTAERERLQARYGALSGRELLEAVLGGEFAGRIAVTSSFGAESAVLLDLVASVDRTVPVIFLDTGELFDETLAYRDLLGRRLGLTNIVVVSPTDDEKAEAAELWRTDPDRCCQLRKVRPLARAMAGFDALVDGRKRAHGFERADLSAIEVSGGVVKVSPLWDWPAERIEAAFVAADLPRHPLTAQGYRSIGCWPCTRPTAEGEPARSGRWAGRGKSECGIHTLTLRDGAGI
ncbi:MAG: phosphoadenylyl-sulfate reductase [Actinomycetota bacterium]